MKITKHKKYGYTYTKFKGKYIKGIVYDAIPDDPDDEGGSGVLEVGHPKGSKFYVRNGSYCEESGTHKMRVEDIKILAEIYTEAYKELMELEKKL